MSVDEKRLEAFIQNSGIITPCDEEDFPLSVEEDEDSFYWVAFESRDWGLRSRAVNLDLYRWGQLPGYELLKYISTKSGQRKSQVLLLNPGTDAQLAMNEEIIVQVGGVNR